MKRFIYIFIIALQGSISFAQTPYDSFAPEVSRPMLDLDFISARNAYHAQQAITTDTLLYIVDMRDGSVIDTISLTDELRKWLSVDPLADKYPNISPYAYAAWNPIRFIDPDGREITITGEDGMTVSYAPGGKYEGNDRFTMNMWSQLEAINNTKSGSIVIQELVDDQGPIFNITNETTKGPNGIYVKGYVPEKRKLKMGGSPTTKEKVGHELFHAYQDLYGYGGASCANDVEAYLFQGIVASELYMIPFTMPFELQSDTKSQYTETIRSIMQDDKLDMTRLGNLVNGFKQFSNAGIMGVAENYTITSKNQQYKILNFWR